MEVSGAAWSAPPALTRLSPWQLTLATTASRRIGSEGGGNRLKRMACSHPTYDGDGGLDGGKRPVQACPSPPSDLDGDRRRAPGPAQPVCTAMRRGWAACCLGRVRVRT